MTAATWKPRTRDVNELLNHIRRFGDYQMCKDMARTVSRALVGVGVPAIATLVEVLHNSFEQVHVRVAAAEALGEIGDSRAIDPLASELDSPVWQVEVAVTEALGKMPASRAAGLLLEKIKKGDPSCHLRDALAAVGSRAVGLLVPALEDPDWGVVQAAARALRAAAWKPADNKPCVRFRLVTGDLDGCAAFGKAAIEPLVDALQTGPTDIHKPAVKALGMIGDSRALDSLLPLLNSESCDMPAAAADTLAQIGDVRAVEPLAKRLEMGGGWIGWR